MELVLETKERKLLFRFTTRAWLNIENQLGSLNILLERMSGDERPMDATVTLIAETAKAGDLHAGGDGKIDREYIIDHLTPGQIKKAARLAKTAVTAGMRREEIDQDDGEVIDAILLEIEAEKRAKKATAGEIGDRILPQEHVSDTV